MAGLASKGVLRGSASAIKSSASKVKSYASKVESSASSVKSTASNIESTASVIKSTASKVKGYASNIENTSSLERAASKVEGFTLIEVLVALLIVMTAVFGSTLLLLFAAQNSRDAVLQMRALHYMEDIFERIRANPAGRYEISYEAKPAASVNCAAASCDSAQMASFEVAHWKCLLGGPKSRICSQTLVAADALALCADFGLPDRCYALPKGDGQIKVAGRKYTISIRWASAYAGKSEENMRELVMSSLL